MTTPRLADLLPLALNMTASLSAEDRTRELIKVVHSALPCDSVALLRLEDDELVPVACSGLSEDIYGRRFKRSEHPRLDIICAGREPTRFPADSPLPDPYDSLTLGDARVFGGQVHSCLGCPLWVESELIGVLTADALESGAFDDLSDAFLNYMAALAGATLRTNALMEALEQRAEHQGMVAHDLLSEVLGRGSGLLIGDSEVLHKLRTEIELVGRSEFPVLVTGETGVGKELVARMLHASSPRSEQPLVYVNCAALPDSVVESELFGHAKGAFTGADRERLGKFRVADGATLFLDEIGELPLTVQPKLLRALQEGEIQCVGSDKAIRVNVRIIAASNRDLPTEVRAGRFRSDLLHRLDVCRIHVPALRDHPSDIPHLAGQSADRNRTRLGCGPIRFSASAQDVLMRSEWPGNVRELENVVSRGVLRATARAAPGEIVLIEAGDLDPSSAGPPRPHPAPAEPSPTLEARPLKESVEEHKRQRIRAALDNNEKNWAAAARELGVERANLHHLAKRLGLK